MQRLFDLTLATLGLLVTLPLTLLIVLALLLFDFGNPVFVHRRVGREGEEFGLIKFRTMRRNAGGVGLTVARDARITPIGRILRRLKLDELPQLLNVAAGQMAIVGPRPETPEFVAGYDAAQREILRYKPGLTDPASLKYRHEEKILAKFADPVDVYIKTILPDKIALSLAYQKRRTIWSDVGIIVRTILAISRSHRATKTLDKNGLAA
ncbi:MAG: sugar transferase [candidate division Zixibacteria bacterium]|nr:sugar transferase [candidate division Zixibacteria bacterium]